jgi:hypothetical protein
MGMRRLHGAGWGPMLSEAPAAWGCGYYRVEAGAGYLPY